MKTFYDMVKDTKNDCSDLNVVPHAPKDEFMIIYALGILTLNIGIYVGWYHKENKLYFYSIILYMHSSILMYHGWKMREFFIKPNEEEIKEMEEENRKKKVDWLLILDNC